MKFYLVSEDLLTKQQKKLLEEGRKRDIHLLDILDKQEPHGNGDTITLDELKISLNKLQEGKE